MKIHTHKNFRLYSIELPPNRYTTERRTWSSGIFSSTSMACCIVRCTLSARCWHISGFWEDGCSNRVCN